MKTIKFTILLIFLSMLATAQQKMDFNFNGFIDTYHALRSQSPYNFMSSRSRLRTEFDVNKGKSYLFASVNSVYNSVIAEETKIELREAFFKYSAKNWELKAGRQIVIWGVSDGLRITDIISPMDMTEFLARDYDDIRIPVTAFKYKYIKDFFSAELIFVPVPSFYILPYGEDNPWTLFPVGGYPDYNVNLDTVPPTTIENSEYGGRLSFFLSGIDISICVLHSWNKMPVFSKSFSVNMDTVFIRAIHNQMDMIGFDISFPVRQFVIRGEAAAYFGELQSLESELNGKRTIKKNALNYLIGIDWYPGHDWTFSIQYSQKFISNYINILDEEMNTYLGTFSIKKNILRGTLSLTSFTYIDFTNKGFFSRNNVEYALSDEIHLMAGYDWFFGDGGMFGYYKNNSEYWIKAKYCF